MARQMTNIMLVILFKRKSARCKCDSSDRLIQFGARMTNVTGSRQTGPAAGEACETDRESEYTMMQYSQLAAPRLTALGRLTDAPADFRAGPPERPVLYRSGDDFRDLFSLLAMDRLLSFAGRRHPDFGIVHAGAGVPDGHYTRDSPMYRGLPDTRKISHELADGSAIVLNGLQEYHEPLGVFTRRLAHDMSRPVDAVAHAMPSKSQGFASHFDTQDAFIIQIEGCTDWTLREPALRRPLAHESWDLIRRDLGRDTGWLETPGPWQELTLAPGDSLWLPRGWVHSARGGQRMSLHLTLRVPMWTRHWAVLEWMSQPAQAPGRAYLPADFISDDDRAMAAVRRLRAELADWFQHVPDTELVRILRRAAIRQLPVPSRQVSALADGELAPDQEFAVHQEAVFAVTHRGQQLALHLSDRIVRLPLDAAEVCAEILGLQRFTVGNLSCEVDPAVRADAIRVLWAEGVISRRPA